MSNYWYSVHGKKSLDFIAGVKAGVTAFAIWHSGKQFVGALQEPIEKIYKDIDEGLGGAEDGSGDAGTEQS